MGNLENHLRNTYETMEEQNELSSIKWRLVDSGIDLKKNNIELTQEEQECINNLKNLLNDVETSTNDLKLLQQVMDKSNVKFQSNNQTLEEANMRLYDPVPKDSQVYKPPLQKTLGAITLPTEKQECKECKWIFQYVKNVNELESGINSIYIGLIVQSCVSYV
uniref:Uncharacterized protein n=1 Tax=Rhizophagus irregularis (strain DAOM 181602 / DAOM 197198 / MUCL 43194) TaxID=747089 RepID=U9TDM6_RHIID